MRFLPKMESSLCQSPLIKPIGLILGFLQLTHWQCEAVRQLHAWSWTRAPLMLVCGSKWLCCHTGCQEVSRCPARCESEESMACRQENMQVRDPLWLWNSGQMSPEVQNRGITGLTKRTDVLQKLFWKRKEIMCVPGLQCWAMLLQRSFHPLYCWSECISSCLPNNPEIFLKGIRSNLNYYIGLTTMGTACSEFGYNEYPVTTSRFFSCGDSSVIDTNIKEILCKKSTIFSLPFLCRGVGVGWFKR